MVTEPDSPVIRVARLTKYFGERAVLRGVDLEVRPGETMVIMGGSGCGKTTLMKHMIGLHVPDEGEVEVCGKRIDRIDEQELDDLRRRYGVLFQGGALFTSMTVAENVALPLQEHTDLDAETIEIVVRIKLEQVGLREAAGRAPSELSGGMRKRVALARALALDPELLFCDEPSAGLDPVTTAEIDELIGGLTRMLGVTSVIVTHVMESAFRIADRMAMLDGGRMLMVGTREQFAEVRDAQPSGDNDRDLIRQFIRGDADGPMSQRRTLDGYEQDIMRAAEGL